MTIPRLFCVRVMAEYLVVANSKDDATKVVEQQFCRGGNELEVDDTSEMTAYPGGWDKDAIPYGYRDPADPDRTVEKWIEMGHAPEYTATQRRFQEMLAKGSLPTYPRITPPSKPAPPPEQTSLPLPDESNDP